MKNPLKRPKLTICSNALLTTLLVMIIFWGFQNFPILDFKDRVIGNTILYNFDTMGQIRLLMISLFVVFPILFFLFYYLYKKLYLSTPPQLQKFNQRIVIFGLISYAFGFFAFLNRADPSIAFLPAIILSIIAMLNLLLFKLNQRVKSKISTNYLEYFEWCCLISIPLSCFLSLLFYKLLPFTYNTSAIFALIYLISLLLIFFLLKKFNFSKLTKASTIFLSMLIIHPVSLELYNILNQHNIFISHKIPIILFIYITSITLSAIYYKFFAKNSPFNYKKYFYIIIIIGLAMFAGTNNLTTTVQADLFETSNHGSSIYEAVEYQKIPIIENYSAHMLKDQLSGLIYNLFNNDLFGALFSPYSSYKILVMALIFFLLFKTLIGPDYAFLATLLIPFSADSGFSYLYLGVISIFALLYAIRKNTFWSYTLLWLILIILCLLQLDIGFAASLASLATLVYLLVFNQKKYHIKPILFSLIPMAILCFITFCVLCLLKNIDPILRLTEFLKLSLSNNNWALANIGDPNTYVYALAYFVTPILVVLSLVYLLIVEQKHPTKEALLLIFLGLFYVFNFQRGLVRHSLAENTLKCILSFALIYFALFLYYIKPKYKITPIIAYSGLIVIFSLAINPQFKNCDSLATKAINKELSYNLESQATDKKVQRIVLPEIDQAKINELKQALDLILDDNKTYLDFSNQTLLYSLLGYEKPVYVNQSPALLSGEQSQKYFISEITNFNQNIPVALKALNETASTELDGILNDYRYYLVSEYIYNHYKLLARINDYEIWVTPEKFEYAKNSLEEHGVETIDSSSLDYNESTINLGFIPYIWGKENQACKTIENLSIEEHNQNYSMKIQSDNINKETGNYLILEIDNTSDSDILASLGLLNQNLLVDTIDFAVPSGTHIYKIRISSFYAWQFNHIDRFSLTPNTDLKLKSAQIADGDTL